MGMKNSVSYEEGNKSYSFFFPIHVMQQRPVTVSRESRTLEGLRQSPMLESSGNKKFAITQGASS